MAKADLQQVAKKKICILKSMPFSHSEQSVTSYNTQSHFGSSNKSSGVCKEQQMTHPFLWRPKVYNQEKSRTLILPRALRCVLPCLLVPFADSCKPWLTWLVDISLQSLPPFLQGFLPCVGRTLYVIFSFYVDPNHWV